MVRFLVAATCLLALLVGAAVLCSRFTVTITVRPVDAEPRRLEPATVPEPAKPAPAPAARKVDSHHTKGA